MSAATIGARTVRDAVREALIARGCTPPESLPAGRWIRLAAPNKRPGNDAIGVKIADDERVGWIKNFITDDLETVLADYDVDPAERQRIAAESARHRARQNEARMLEQSKAIAKARDAWNDAEPCVRPPYCDRKGVFGHGCRWDDDTRTMLVPLRDADGELRSLQRISDDGTKRCWPGAPVAGAFFTVGTIDPVGEALLCEGFATAATLFEETGRTTVAAMFAGNLLAVARALRARHPELRIVVCADDDRQTAGNPGRTKATEAAGAIGGRVAFPELCRACRCTDFNDARQCERRRGVA